MIKKILLSLLIVALLLLTILPALRAFAFSDIEKDQEDTYLIWNQLGIVQGYQDNTLRLNEKITKAEFITMINRALELKGSAFITFTDVAETDWFYQEVKTAVANKYLYNEEKLNGNEALTYLTITPMLYKLYGFKPANKDYLANIKDLPNINEQLRSQLNTLVKENILWEAYIKEDKPITRLMALTFIQDLVREKFIGSMLNMYQNDTSKDIFKLLKLNVQKYYYYDSTNSSDLILGRTPSNLGNPDLGKCIVKRIEDCADKNMQNKDRPMPPNIWIDRQTTHIYYGMLNLNQDYVVYKSRIYKEDNSLVVANIEQVLYYDRSKEIAKLKQEKQKQKQLELTEQLKAYMPMANELHLNFNTYNVYAPDHLNDLLTKNAEPLKQYNSDEYCSIKDNLVELQYQYYNAGDKPFAYWIAKDKSCIYAINIKNNGYYQVLKIQKDIDNKWKIKEIKTELKSASSKFNIFGNNISEIFKQLKIDENNYLYAPLDFTKSQLPALVVNPSKIMSLEMTKMNLSKRGGVGSFYPSYFIHKNSSEAYGVTTQNDNPNKLIVIKYTYSEDSDKWISKMVYPEYKQQVAKIPYEDQSIIDDLKINSSDYVYYPYEKSSVFAYNQAGPLVNETWDLGEKLLKAVDRAYDIQDKYDNNYPSVLIKKDGSKAYAICKLINGKKTAYLFNKEMYMYESKNSTKVFPVWSIQQLLPQQEYEIFAAPKQYTNVMVKELKLDINDYIYYPSQEQSKLSQRYPSLFKDSCIAGSLAFHKGSQLLREQISSITDGEIGCFIHLKGDSVYIIQQKSNGIIYIYKLVLDKTAEGYVEWNDVNDWMIKAD